MNDKQMHSKNLSVELDKSCSTATSLIIDDLDTRCPYHCSEKIGQCNNPSPDNKYIYCLDYKDCIYKQYARKEQECEQQKAELELFKTSNQTTIDQLKKENEELKKILHYPKYRNEEGIKELKTKSIDYLINEIVGNHQYMEGKSQAVYKPMLIENNQLKNEIKDLEDLAKFKTEAIRELRQQLKRKEQECERWKSNFNGKVSAIEELLKQLDQLKGENKTLFKAIEEVNKINKRLESENDELKEQLTTLDDEDVVVEITVKQFEEYKKLKAENEELREELQKYKDNEQQEKEMQKLYNKFNGNSLIEKSNPSEN